MSKVASTLAGFLAVASVFTSFVAYEVLMAGNRAVGVGVLPYVLTRPSFLFVTAVLCVWTLYKVARHGNEK